MLVDKDDVVDLLRSRGEHDKAASVECALPKQVDIEADAGLLHQFDVNISEVKDVAAENTEPDGPLAGTGA
ncbi:MAG TPA: hypothetical protein VLB29_14435 [Nocardioidaceae bacterium]|nr:hypothetical protein [Nocardioidaceae bacterium]